MRFIQVHCNDDTLSGCQTVGFDHNRRAFAADVIVRLGGIGKRLIFRSRNAVALHECLREILRTFQLRRFFGRAENLQSLIAENIDDAGGQWRFRTNHSQRDIFFLGKLR